MIRILEKILWKVGIYGPVPSPPVRPGIEGPYVYLHDAPRHQPAVLNLDDDEFEIADGFSFYWMHREIYGDEVYRFFSSRPRPRIIDCGANYGVSVVWFKRNYPDSRIIAVEADPGIYDMLKRNVERRSLSDTTLINRAVSGSLGDVCFHRIGADSGRVFVDRGDVEGSDVTIVNVPAVLLDELIGDEEVDFLKIDIEGAELDAISASNKLGQVRQMFIEYHSFINAPQRFSELLSILEREGFRYYINRIYAPRNPYLEITANQSMDLQLSVFATRLQPDCSAGCG